ncbi:MAG: Tetratricopeptide repeat domain protein [Myxococcales bacterium]|nr:Tetratricopeptide repeat domain protein [Myxococcales bacterium]
MGLVGAAYADVAKAKAHYERGLALYQVGEYRQALDEFKAAHLEKPDPAFLYNMGQCLRQLGDSDNALVFYKRYLSLGGADERLRDEVERRVREIELARTAKNKSSASRPSQPTPAPVPRLSDTTLAAASPPPSPAEPAQPRTPLPRWVPWASAGATIVVGIFAAVTGARASSRYDELVGSCAKTTSGCSADEIASVKSRAHTANTLWVLTGVAALGTSATVYINTREAGVAGVWRF